MKLPVFVEDNLFSNKAVKMRESTMPRRIHCRQTYREMPFVPAPIFSGFCRNNYRQSQFEYVEGFGSVTEINPGVIRNETRGCMGKFIVSRAMQPVSVFAAQWLLQAVRPLFETARDLCRKSAVITRRDATITLRI